MKKTKVPNRTSTRNKNIELANYLLQNKDLRVWQNIRNWSDYAVIYGSKDANIMGGLIEDTFYL